MFKPRKKIEPQRTYCMYYEDGSNLSCLPFPLTVGEETFRLFSVTATTYILWTSKLDSPLDLSIVIGQGPWTQVYKFRGHGRQLEAKRFSSITWTINVYCRSGGEVFRFSWAVEAVVSLPNSQTVMECSFRFKNHITGTNFELFKKAKCGLPSHDDAFICITKGFFLA